MHMIGLFVKMTWQIYLPHMVSSMCLPVWNLLPQQ